MSIVALKRKGQIIHTLSGKSPNSVMVVHGPGQQTVLTQGGGFSLNGKQRNIGYIGKNSLNSVGGTKMRPGTESWKGNGGCCGEYKVNPSPNNQCCVTNIGVKPSVLNTKGMLANKYRWKKTAIPDNTFTSQGFEVPSQKQLENTYHRWVSNNSSSYNMKDSSQQRTENLAAVLTYKNPPKDDSATGRCFSSGHHIGGRYVPPKPYSKFLNNFAGTSSRAMSNSISKRASPFPKGYNRPYPSAPSANQCTTPTIHPSNPTVMNTYYYDQNNTSIFPCSQ
jgi:hypothetical protein